MKVGRIKIDSVYMFADVTGENVEHLPGDLVLEARIEELRNHNRKLRYGEFYGDFVINGSTLSYKTFELVPVSENVDLAYINSKNMTELKKKFKSEFGGKKNVRLVTFKNGEVVSVSKKTTPARVLLVEEYEQGPLEEEVVSDSILSDRLSSAELEKMNMLPDARFIYHKDYYATDYESSTTLYTVKVYRVLERATSLGDIDKKVMGVQNEYMAREKYGIRDSSKIKMIKIPTLKEYPVFYKDEKHYVDPQMVLRKYKAKVTDAVLMETLVNDPYTNLKPKLDDEDSMENVSTKKETTEEQESKRDKVLRLKRILRSESRVFENMKDFDRRSLDEYREYELQKIRVQDVINQLLITLMYRYPKSKEINYSIVRHLADIVRDRENTLEELANNYMDGLVKYTEELERKGYTLEPSKPHMF